jgi:uncharacterized protein YdeI (YjbR/CyaY-like superfamily)
MPSTAYQSFESPQHLSRWLKANHSAERELWVRIYKKQSGTASVTWEDCVIAAIAWGWIDGQKKSLDELSYLQRLTPRRAKSNWSKKNCDHAERLIKQGLIWPSGLAHVAAAKQDGRWDNAYAGSSEMVIPADFLTALEKHADAKAFYETLDRANRYSIYYRLHTAKRPEIREKRMDVILKKLSRRENFS